MARIVGVHRDNKNSGGISHYKLDNGEIVDHETALRMTDAGEIEGVTVRNSRGGQTLFTNPDDDPNNNISALPQFNLEDGQTSNTAGE